MYILTTKLDFLKQNIYLLGDRGRDLLAFMMYASLNYILVNQMLCLESKGKKSL